MSLTGEDKDWIVAQLRDLRQEFKEDLERVETKLLTEFHKWASPTEMRLRSNSLVMQAFDPELSNLKDRLNKLDPPIPPH